MIFRMGTLDIRSKATLGQVVRKAASDGAVTLTDAGTPVAVARPLDARARHARGRLPFGLSHAKLKRQCRAANEADRRDGWERFIEWPK